MSTVYKLGLGAVADVVKIGKGGRHIKNNTNGIEIRNAANNALDQLQVADATFDSSAVTKKQMETYVSSYGSPIVSKQMNGSEPAGVEGDIAIVTTAFAGHGARTLWRYNGTAWVQLTVVDGRTIVVTTALTGGSDTYLADHVYEWDLTGGSWIEIGPAATVTAVIKTATVTLNFDTTSPLTVVTVPAGSRIRRFSVDVTVAFNGATESTLSLGVAGTVTKYATTAEVDLRAIGTYEIDCNKLEASQIAVIASFVKDGATTGASTITIEYAIA